MGRWLDAVKMAGRRPIWLDDTEYTTRLLASGAAPWADPASWANWRRTALGLLNPDVAVLDLSAAANAWLVPRNGVIQAQGQPGAPLRSLVSNAGFQAHLRELLRALRAMTSKPLALTMASPRKWVIDTYLRAFSQAVEPDEDVADDAAADIAQLLRTLSDGGVDTVLLREDTVAASQASTWLNCYGSVFNVAHHYRWDVGVLLPGGAPANIPGVDFFIAPRDALGLSLDPQFWRGGPPPADTSGPGFIFGEIPADAQPHAVLDRLGKLR
ncbi:MAG: hypothetical protein JWO52_231 [Gammaproteobacteria bacterium]|nr:hypothetical protein [Gammaproteobacteria bacterium]